MIGLYTPYWKTRGGGEKYLLSMAKALIELGERVVIVCKEPIRETIDYFGLNFSPMNLFARDEREFQEITDCLDLLIFNSNDRPIKHSCPRSIQIQQMPLQKFSMKKPTEQWHRRGLITQMRKAEKVIVYSHFVADALKKNFNLDCDVLYPPVEQFKPLEKKNIILSVGRFFRRGGNFKNHEILIKVFKEMNLEGWEYHIAGSCNNEDYLHELMIGAGSGDTRIHFHPNASHDELARLYGEAKILWHGAGYGTRNVEKMESFGISTVEAMSASCIPLIYDGGGSREIVEDFPSLRWKNVAELKRATADIVRVDWRYASEHNMTFMMRSDHYSFDRFKDEIASILRIDKKVVA